MFLEYLDFLPMNFPDNSTQKLRACLNCAIIQSTNEFKQRGCPNCPCLNTNKERNLAYTTSITFKGLIALKTPRTSWIAKWHRLGGYVPGLYAMVVEGILGDKYLDALEKEGKIYINRSKSFELQ